METQPILKSDYTLKKEREDKEIYDAFISLMAIDGAQIQEVYKELRKQFPQIYANSTFWAIRKRVEARAKKAKTN